MKRLQSYFLVLCCFLFAVAAGSAQTGSTKQFITLPHHDASTPQGMEGGMWRIDENFESILQLKNVLLNHSIIATPVLYMEDGTAYQLPSVTLEPAGVASVNLGTALAEMPADVTPHRSLYGMVGVKYNWSWPGAVMALVRNIDEAEMVSFYSDLHADVTVSHAVSSPQKLQEVAGLWWKPYASTNGFLFLSNTLLKPMLATVLIYGSTGAVLGQRALTLGSHQSVHLMLSDVLDSQPPTGTMGSLRITYQGPEFSLSAVGGLEDDTNGYSASLNLQEMHPEHARNLAVHQVVLDAPGIMFGEQDPMMQFPENTSFMPYGYLHNASAQTRQVSVTATLTDPKGPQTYALAALTLAPNSTEQIDYKDILKKLNLPSIPYIDISTSYMGNDGDVLVEEGSVDQTGNYVFQVEPQTEGWTISKTLCHWELHDETDSMISLWNYSSSPEDLKLTFYYTGGKYVLPVHLEPHADYELDLATLVHSAQADASGSIIPPSITEGSAVLSDATDDRNHIDVASSTAVFNVRTATCGVTCQYCNGISEYDIIPAGLISPPGESVQAQQEETYNTGAVYYVDSGNWSSTNTSVATINTSGVGNAVSAGSADFDVYVDGVPSPAGYICLGGNASCPIYNVSASGPVTVQVPTDSTVTSTVAQHSASCPAGQAGWYRQVDKVVTDQNGNTIVAANQDLTETLTVNSPAPLGGANNVTTGSGQTNADGVFTDTYQICSTACPSSTATNSVTQDITDTWNSHAYQLKPVSLVYGCSAITADGK